MGVWYIVLMKHSKSTVSTWYICIWLNQGLLGIKPLYLIVLSNYKECLYTVWEIITFWKSSLTQNCHKRKRGDMSPFSYYKAYSKKYISVFKNCFSFVQSFNSVKFWRKTITHSTTFLWSHLQDKLTMTFYV